MDCYLGRAVAFEAQKYSDAKPKKVCNTVSMTHPELGTSRMGRDPDRQRLNIS